MTLIIINDEYLEMNTKNCDNYFWLNYKNATFNMALDKVNEEVIKKPEMNKIIKEIKTVNDEIIKAVKEEKKKLEEEERKLNKKRKRRKIKVES